MKNIIEYLKERDLDLEFKLGGRVPPALTTHEVTERAVNHVLKERKGYPTQEEFDANFDRDTLFDRVLGPFRLFLLGQGGEVVAHTRTDIPTFALVKDIADVMLRVGTNINGKAITKILVKCAGGELLPAEFIQEVDNPSTRTLEA